MVSARELLNVIGIRPILDQCVENSSSILLNKIRT